MRLMKEPLTTQHVQKQVLDCTQFLTLFYELTRLVKESNRGLKNKILKIGITGTPGQ